MRSRAPGRRLAAIAIGVAAVAAACGGGEGNPSIASPAGGVVQLVAKNVLFIPTRLAAPAGRVTIDFHNRDSSVQHNVHLSGGGVNEKTSIETGPITQQLTVTLRAGTYLYICDVHPAQMRGELTVTG